MPPPQQCCFLRAPFLASTLSIFVLLLQSLRSPETSRSCYKTFCESQRFFFLLLLLSLMLWKAFFFIKVRLSKFYTAVSWAASATPVGLMWEGLLHPLWFSHPVCVYAEGKLALAEITQQCRHNKTEWPERAVVTFSHLLLQRSLWKKSNSLDLQQSHVSSWKKVVKQHMTWSQRRNVTHFNVLTWAKFCYRIVMDKIRPETSEVRLSLPEKK